MNRKYEITLCGLKSQLNDAYKNIFILAAFFSLFFWTLEIKSTMTNYMTLGIGLGALPSLLLCMTCKMKIQNDADESFIEKYLSDRLHIKSESGWIPKLPKFLYFKSQAVVIENGFVFGPRLTISKLQKALSANHNSNQR